MIYHMKLIKKEAFINKAAAGILNEQNNTHFSICALSMCHHHTRLASAHTSLCFISAEWMKLPFIFAVVFHTPILGKQRA